MSLFIFTCAFADSEGPCAEAGPKHCKGVPFKGGKMFRCLVSKMESGEIQGQCKVHLNALLRYKSDCKKEIKKHCSDGPFYCLLWASKAQAKLNPQCQKRIKEKATYRERCPSEIQKLCSKESNDTARLVSCLKTHRSKLSKQCVKELEK